MRLRLGTRASALARAQAEAVAERLGAAGHAVTVDARRSAGDRGSGPEDKSRWVVDLDEALRSDEIDLAVHSAKDVPGELAAGIALVAVPPREDPRDVLCGAPGVEALGPGARVGTGSLRRAAALRALRDDLRPVELRGNVDTRLRKLGEGECDAIVLALAGLRRLGRADAAGGVLPVEAMVPAAGQGALAICARADDDAVRAALAVLDDPEAHRALRAERALVSALGADCHTPVGALALREPSGERLRVLSFVGAADGSGWLRDTMTGPEHEPEAVGRAAAERLLSAGAGELLAS